MTFKTLRNVISASIGSYFEWFDLIAYAYFASTISKLFFPSSNASVSLLLTFATFASSYLIRPLGAIIIGSLADAKGRKYAMTVTLGLMVLGTFIIAVVPSYQSIGITAPFLLLISRLVQGFSAGGEFGTANTYLTELSNQHKSLFATLQFSTTGFALLTASLFAWLTNQFLSAEQLQNWGWRLPFFYGLLLAPAALYIRHKADESIEFEEEKVHQSSFSALQELFAQHKKQLLFGFMIVAAGNVMSYLNIYMPTFAKHNLGIHPDDAYLAAILSNLVMCSIPFLSGWLADRIGALKIMSCTLIVGIFCLIPLFHFLTQSPSLISLAVFQCTISFLFYSCYFSLIGVLLSGLFPTSCRSSGVSIAYVASQLFFGGITPLVIGALVKTTGNIMSPIYYVAIIAVFALFALWKTSKIIASNQSNTIKATV